jgi:hypothetical protein
VAIALLSLAIGAGALWLSDRSGMGASEMNESPPMEHVAPDASSQVLPPGQSLVEFVIQNWTAAV